MAVQESKKLHAVKTILEKVLTEEVEVNLWEDIYNSSFLYQVYIQNYTVH